MEVEEDALLPDFQADCDLGPPRMSQEVHPQNLADLFAEDPDCAAQPEAPKVPRSLAFAGASVADDLELKKLQVFVRIRPSATDGAPRWDSENCIHASSEHSLAIAAPETSMAYRSGDRGQTFTFSQVFDAETTQEAYFAATGAPLVEDLLRDPRHNSVMMAYGITAAGKTYTIEGTKTAPGVLPRALSALFAGLAAHTDAAQLAVQVSYCEIYNEAVFDLLEDPVGGGVPAKRPALRLMEDSKGRVTVAGLSEVAVETAEEALAVLRRGAKHRQRAETGLNYSSSRSHSIFGVNLVRKTTAEYVEEESEPEQKVERLGRLAFVDLAGSERAQRTGNVGIRLKESVAINSSLMTLGRCLEALRWNQQQQSVARTGAATAPHRVVPYRESKVTHLFRDALHGYGRVVLSVNVSPCAKDYDETSHVLRYAALAAQIGTLQQAQAPRRTIKAVSPGAMRRAKRKAAEKAAKAEVERAKKAKTDAAAEKEDNEVAAAALAASELLAAAQAEEKEDMGEMEEEDDEEEVVYEVIGRGMLSSDNMPAAPAELDDSEAVDATHESSPLHQQEGALFEEEHEGAGKAAAAAAMEEEEEEFDGTPCTPRTYEDEDGEGDEQADAAYAALQEQVQQLIKDLQAAEERAVLVEAEVREEVAAEMAGLLKGMEESYRERLAAEVAAAEARAAAGPASKPQRGGRKRQQQQQHQKAADAVDMSSSQEEEERAATAVQAALAAAEAAATALREDLELQRAEARSLQERLAAVEASARADAERAAAELESERHRAASLSAALAELRRRSEEVVEHRVREEVTQMGANVAMEIEMAEHQTDRLRKDNASLRAQLGAAMAALHGVSSPSGASLLARVAAACPPGEGCGAQGTPHEVALARARQGVAMEERNERAVSPIALGGKQQQHRAPGSSGPAVARALPCSGGKSGGSSRSRSGGKKSRFAEEAQQTQQVANEEAVNIVGEMCYDGDDDQPMQQQEELEEPLLMEEGERQSADMAAAVKEPVAKAKCVSDGRAPPSPLLPPSVSPPPSEADEMVEAEAEAAAELGAVEGEEGRSPLPAAAAAAAAVSEPEESLLVEWMKEEGAEEGRKKDPADDYLPVEDALAAAAEEATAAMEVDGSGDERKGEAAVLEGGEAAKEEPEPEPEPKAGNNKRRHRATRKGTASRKRGKNSGCASAAAVEATIQEDSLPSENEEEVEVADVEKTTKEASPEAAPVRGRHQQRRRLRGGRQAKQEGVSAEAEDSKEKAAIEKPKVEVVSPVHESHPPSTVAGAAARRRGGRRRAAAVAATVALAATAVESPEDSAATEPDSPPAEWETEAGAVKGSRQARRQLRGGGGKLAAAAMRAAEEEEGEREDQWESVAGEEQQEEKKEEASGGEEQPQQRKPAGAAAGKGGRRRRLLQPSKPLSSQMRSALGELAAGEAPPASMVKAAKKGGQELAAALGLTSPGAARIRSPRRTRR